MSKLVIIHDFETYYLGKGEPLVCQCGSKNLYKSGFSTWDNEYWQFYTCRKCGNMTKRLESERD